MTVYSQQEKNIGFLRACFLFLFFHIKKEKLE